MSLIHHLITAMNKTLYEQDYYLWIEKTIHLLENSNTNKPVNDFSNVDVEERQLLQQKFFKLES